MSRTGLLIALVVAIAGGLLFAAYPALDLAISALFYDPAQRTFTLRASPLLLRLREINQGLIALIVAPAVLALVVKLLMPSRRMLIPSRAAVFLVSTLIMGPGLLANVGFKDNWGRPRPHEISVFGGPERFVPWWDPRGTCRKNCSFVSGESAAAFWTLAPAALAPAPWRTLAYGTALLFGTAVGVLRIALGGHFLSDVVAAAVLIFMVVWTVHGLLYRWRLTRVSDEEMEQTIGRITLPIYLAARNVMGRLRPGPQVGKAGKNGS
jgi:membrane-associated PAP2 superfamily phosphatase